MDLIKGKLYIFDDRITPNNLIQIEIAEVTKYAYRLLYESGRYAWVSKSQFEYAYILFEELGYSDKNYDLPDSSWLLHTHPTLEKELGVPEGHVIVDREDWEKVRLSLGIISKDKIK